MKPLAMILLTMAFTAATTVAAVEVFKPGTFLKHPRQGVCQALVNAYDPDRDKNEEGRRLIYAACVAQFQMR